MPSTRLGAARLSRRTLIGREAGARARGAGRTAVAPYLAFAVAAAVAFPAGPLWSETVEERLRGFDPWVEAVMKEWKTPGLGVAVVEDGRTVFARGYGWRNVEGKLPVTADTLFAIGSNAKSFTATLLAMQVDDGDLTWDEPIDWAERAREREAFSEEAGRGGQEEGPRGRGAEHAPFPSTRRSRR